MLLEMLGGHAGTVFLQKVLPTNLSILHGFLPAAVITVVF